FTAARILPRFGTAGQPLSYLIRARNLGRRTQSGLSVLEDLLDPRPSFRQWHEIKIAEERHFRSFRFNRKFGKKATFKRALAKEAAAPPIPPDKDTDIRIELLPLKRGVLGFRGITFARPDPLGLFRAFSKVRAVDSTLILPRRYPLPDLDLPGSLRYQTGGVALASHVGQSEEFVALRDYRSGDPMRHIHWRSWAKTGTPVVREFEDEFFVRHALVLDTFAEKLMDDIFEEAVSVAASFACTMRTQESLLDLLFVGTESYSFTSGRGLGRSDQMLEVLASVQACHNRSFSELEKLVLDRLDLVSGVVAVLIDWNPARRRFIEKLQSLGVPALVLLIAEPGAGDRIDPGPMASDPANFHVLELGKIEQGLQNLGRTGGAS
ncbi:MAG TPA: DUF58 domain-containing protein, partial [Verrucomicrobiae bacterium]|nr:DUF58 domain-containing protein [Verrucomicrobiae bacterium]